MHLYQNILIYDTQKAWMERSICANNLKFNLGGVSSSRTCWKATSSLRCLLLLPNLHWGMNRASV